MPRPAMERLLPLAAAAAETKNELLNEKISCLSLRLQLLRQTSAMVQLIHYSIRIRTLDNGLIQKESLWFLVEPN